MMNKNKIGQFSDVMTFVPVLLVVITLMALFLLASFWAANSREKGNDEAFNQDVNKNSVLLKTINIKDGKMIVFEALVNLLKGKVSHSDLEQGLMTLVNEQYPCLGLAYADYEWPGNALGGDERNNFFIHYDGKPELYNPGSLHVIFPKYRDDGILNKFSFTLKDGEEDKEIFVEYYYGRCLS